MEWGNNQELFFSELEIGHSWAEYVAAKLNENQVSCYATEMRKALTKEEIKEFRNEKDVVLTGMAGCIEVKSRRLRFSDSPSSFPMDSAFVDTVSGWGFKDPRPLAVCIVSQFTGSILVVPVSTQSQWGRVYKFDRVRKINDTWFTCPKSLLKPFSELVSWLRARQV